MFKSTILLFFISMGSMLEQSYGEHLRITTILDTPYLMRSDGDITFKGYSVDLAEKLTDLLNSTYTLTLVKDSSFGRKSVNSNEWGGMIGEIIRGEADLAISSLTITRERARVVDFSTPFMESRLAILANKQKPWTGPFQLQSSGNVFVPMTFPLWVALILSAILTCLIFTVIEKKLKNVYEDNGASDLFTFTPRSFAGSTIKLVFVIFIGFFLAAYTANFSVFRSVDFDHVETHYFESVDDLPLQAGVKYGMVKGGSTWNFFKKSTNPTYKRMFDVMEKNDFTYTSNSEGVQRVRDSQGTYTFIMESPMARYVTNRQCDEIKTVDIFGPTKGYGVATQKNSNLTERVNLAILELQENGFLEDLEKKWWNIESTCSSSNQYRNEDGPVIHVRPLTIENMALIFIFLVIGLVVSAGIAVYEIHTFKKNMI